MKRFQDKVVVVTGGSSGIGLAAAEQFVAEGAHVYITGRRQPELDAVAAAIGHNVTAVQADASVTADLERLYRMVGDRHGRVDVVFANAGMVVSGAIGDLSEEQYNRQFDVNVKGVLFTVQLALPLMSAGGAIVLNASIVASKGYPATSLYSASKAAVRSFARTWTIDLKDRGIRVNAVSPGPTETGVFEASGYTPEQIVQTKSQLASAVPMGRMGRAAEVARAVLFLASDDSSFVTGTELFVDGGIAQV
jgi:NAD(P)-dependent dehydrogenase (short-subunit alcohol dehydrogenase family)